MKKVRLWVGYQVCRLEDDTAWVESSNITNINEAREELMKYRKEYQKSTFGILKVEEKRTILDE